MTLETALLSALGAVTGALVYIAKLLWLRSESCEKDRIELRLRVERLESDHGQAKGELISYKRCPADECPFRQDDEVDP